MTATKSRKPRARCLKTGSSLVCLGLVGFAAAASAYEPAASASPRMARNDWVARAPASGSPRPSPDRVNRKGLAAEPPDVDWETYAALATGAAGEARDEPSAERGDDGAGGRLAGFDEYRVADRALGAIRAGFRTRQGIEMDIGFDLVTKVNGVQVARSAMNYSPPGLANKSGHPRFVVPVSTSATGTEVTSDTKSVVSSVETQDSDPGNIRTIVRYQDSDGTTEVIHNMTGGGITSAVINTQSNVHIEQINNVEIGVMNLNLFHTTRQIQHLTGSSLHGLSDVMRDALIGASGR